MFSSVIKIFNLFSDCDDFSVHESNDSVDEDENGDCGVHETKYYYEIDDVIFVYEGEYFVGQMSP